MLGGGDKIKCKFWILDLSIWKHVPWAYTNLELSNKHVNNMNY